MSPTYDKIGSTYPLLLSNQIHKNVFKHACDCNNKCRPIYELGDGFCNSGGFTGHFEKTYETTTDTGNITSQTDELYFWQTNFKFLINSMCWKIFFLGEVFLFKISHTWTIVNSP